MTSPVKALIFASVLAFSIPAWSANTGSADAARDPASASAQQTDAEMNTPEMRQKMAQMHEQTATCLKSNRDMSECRQEMMKNCPMMKDGECQMMGMMHGKKHGMMRGTEAKKSQKTQKQ